MPDPINPINDAYFGTLSSLQSQYPALGGNDQMRLELLDAFNEFQSAGGVSGQDPKSAWENTVQPVIAKWSQAGKSIQDKAADEKIGTEFQSFARKSCRL